MGYRRKHLSLCSRRNGVATHRTVDAADLWEKVKRTLLGMLIL